jgi:competence protein ComEA
LAERLQRYRGILFFLAVVLVLGGLAAFERLRPRPDSSAIDTLTPAPTPEPSPTPGSMQVYVTGAVARPDVYSLPPGSIVRDAVLSAGGATDVADLERINLASRLSDGQHVHVPRQNEENPPVELPARMATDGMVNVNTADSATLETLPGIGPALAQRIIAYREAEGPFAEIDDLMDVAGIGPATLEKIRDRISVR